MKPEARLDSAVFQLTPTRTRCDLVIIANGKSEKLASGLLNPFLAHLKTAQDQIVKGGYSITLEPGHATDAFWFTKGTVERFVRFVSTPEVLERVNTIESEILQIEEAIAIQGNENLGLNTLEDHQMKSTEYIEGGKPMSDADAQTAIVLYKPGSQSNPADSNGSVALEENSKVQLLRVLETRKIVLQKEQGMAFARAAAAGFDMDYMAHLITFAECFGALRLKEACLKFMELWRVKHETGQWFEVEAAEAMSMRSGFSPFNSSGIVLAGTASGGDVGTESNGNDATTDHNCDKRIHSDPQVSPGPPEYFQGQFQQPAYRPWVMHPQPGPPVFQPYPMQGMPYYQNYPASGPFYQPPYPPTEDPRFFNTQHGLGRRRSKNNKDNDADSETSTRSPEDDADQSLSESEKEESHGRKPHKWGGRPGKKKSGMVVIKNLNYITSKKHGKSGHESQSVSDAETEGSHLDVVEGKNKKSSQSSKKKEDSKQLLDGTIHGNDADSGNWQAFQNFLLRSEEKMTSSIDGDIFAGERELPMKRKQKLGESEPVLTPERDSGNFHEARTMEFDAVSEKVNRIRQVGSNDEMLTSTEGRGFRESHQDAQFIEVESGGGGYRKMASDDFMIYGRGNKIISKNSSDPLAEHVYENARNLEKTSYVATDESFIVPLRSGSIDQLETDERTAIDMDTEFPLSYQREDSSSNANNHLSYEPDDLTMMPERTVESEYFGYDPAIDYDMHIAVGVVKQETIDQEDDLTSTNEESKKSDKEKKLKASQNGLERRRKDAMMRRGTASKSNPLTEAQKRAEKLRAFKVDLQKAKKANEEEERKRLEALKIERQKRIAARSSSNSVQSPLAAKQTRTGLPAKVSPSSFKGTKFSDSEPGSNSPLRKIPNRNSSVGSNYSQKITKTSRPYGNTIGLTKSVSSLPDLKTENDGAMLEAKVVAASTKRLSDPNVKSVRLASQNAVTTDHIRKKDVASGPQMKKISAIVQLDKTKSATLPELKIRTPRGTSDIVQNKLVGKELSPQGFGSSTTQISNSVQENMTNQHPPRVSNCDDNPVIEKTVVMLENEMVSGPSLQKSEGMTGTTNAAREKSIFVSEYAAIRAPPSPIIMEEVKDPSHQKSDDHVDCYEVVNDFSKDDSHNFSNSVTENFYQAPYARTSSLEDHAASLKHTGTPTVQSELASIHTESIKARISNFPDSSSVDQTAESSEKHRSKESKGFRKLLKFGRKSHVSASGEANMDSDGSVGDDQTEEGSSNDVRMLKNLISQDDGHSGGTPPRAHRPFSILSPFRSSRSNDKKLAA